ncbi:hypothetical protein SAMN05892877_103154 [Rhizobium subbaraonis]|uniref:Uncharacterized protein n=1 Tax=Rhizobium subbaraonis TaxID=908946 RepID=A0A285U8D7_9HYPH|nr:hypothetical protein [Rhizobium subbaraonis]SOC36816.1 hypothetical protein SAMN05892877_103154 [Rhizobium subbaraonis]
MKFLSKLQLPKKVVVLVAGVVVLTGASGAVAVFVGRDAILGPSEERVSGTACTTVMTLRQKRDGQEWIRHYIRSTAEDGDVRIKTALRVAAALSNKEEADLYQVVLMDEAGPALRADMRGRAIGAEVLFSRDPGKISGMTAPFQASVIDGAAAENGEFYGERKALSLAEIKTIVTAMTDKADCLDPNAPEGTGVAENHGEGDAGHAPAHAESEAAPQEHAAAAGH